MRQPASFGHGQVLVSPLVLGVDEQVPDRSATLVVEVPQVLLTLKGTLFGWSNYYTWTCGEEFRPNAGWWSPTGARAAAQDTAREDEAERWISLTTNIGPIMAKRKRDKPVPGLPVTRSARWVSISRQADTADSSASLYSPDRTKIFVH